MLVTRPLLKGRNRRREKTNIYGTLKFQKRTGSVRARVSLPRLVVARLGSALPVSPWLHLARHGPAWLRSGWLGSAQLGVGLGRPGGGSGRPGKAGGGRNVDFMV